MKNLLLSAAVGDICGMPYEFKGRTKNYSDVNLLNPDNDYTDDSVCTFACADALIHNLDMAETLWRRCREEPRRGYGGRFFRWISAPQPGQPYNSYGNGSAMRVAAAGFLAKTEEECVEFAIRTANPTHNHEEGLLGAIATAEVIYYAMQGKDKEFLCKRFFDVRYPGWADRSYALIKPSYYFNETCQLTVPAAFICFLESKDYADCLKLAISLGGDADTLAAIAGPMAYAYYREMPAELIARAKQLLPQWMLDINDEFDEFVEQNLM